MGYDNNNLRTNDMDNSLGSMILLHCSSYLLSLNNWTIFDL